MSVSEGIFVYGIGLGSVDVEALTRLSAATHGTFEHSQDPTALADIYGRVIRSYYDRYGEQLADTGSTTVRSIPGGREVILDGKKRGGTPVKLESMKPGAYKIGVIFGERIWECDAVVEKGHRTLLEARESDLGADLLIVSRPAGATVWLDDDYLGITAISKPISLRDENWAEKAKSDGRQLRVRLVPYGNHRLRLRGMPDFEFGPDQEMEFDLPLTESEVILFVDILRQKAVDQRGKSYVSGGAGDPFQQLDAME